MKGAIDFETEYDDEYSVRKMSTHRYCRDPRFNCYCVSFSREDGKKFAGHPRDFDWDLLRSCDVVFMHNATFDGLVLRQLQRMGVAPSDLQLSLVDTADMAAYFGSARNLKSAAKNFLGLELSKDTRDKMKGKRWDQICESEFGREVLRYGQQDADTTLALGLKLLPGWPEVEREASRIGREKGWRGLPVDTEYIAYARSHLERLVHGYYESIPWVPDEKPLSVPAIHKQARKDGILWVPASFDKRDVKAQEWFEEYGPKVPWVNAVRNYRRANTVMQRIVTMSDGIVDGWLPFELLYFGAGITGRWSGGGVVLRRRHSRGNEDRAGRFNPQNMSRDPMYGVDIRYCIMAPPGKLLYVCDYAQIENRILLWRVKDASMLDQIRAGVHPYKAYATQHLGAPNDIAKTDRIYLTAKACVLGCGYQSGGKTFARTAKNLAGIELTLKEAEELVAKFRASNPRIVQHWMKHQRCLGFSVNNGDPTHEVELASGRVLTYWEPSVIGTTSWGAPQYGVKYGMNDDGDSAYGGLLTENEIQATARDVLRDGWVALDRRGFDVPLTVHDEYVSIGPDHDCEDYKREFLATIKDSSPWAEGCPLSAEIHECEHYEK